MLDPEGRVRRSISVLLTLCLLQCLLASGVCAVGNQGKEHRTVVVLNFVNRNPGDGWDWLGTGLADMLITDLSKSASLMVVERDLMAQMLRELEMVERGVVDAPAAGRAGQIAKAEWVLFGSFIRDGEKIKIEAHIIEVQTGRLVRVELVEGKASELFALEKELAYRTLNRLHVPITEEERRMIDQLPTDSIPAFEHYSRSLDRFDRGEWFDALLQCRLAVRDDPNFLKAATRVAQLYYEVGEAEHAVVQYRKLVKRDTENALPEPVYFRMGRLLEEAFQDDAAARAYERILARHPEYDQPFDIRDPSQPSRGWDDAGGIAGVRALAAAQDISLRVLERLALMQSRAANDFEAARLYSRIVQFSSTHGMALAAGAPYGGFHDRVWGKYRPLYWRFVRQNRDSSLYPPLAVHAIPPKGMTVGPDTEPTHGFFKRQPFWLAPPGKEIAGITISVDCDAGKPIRGHDSVQVEWNEPGIGFAVGRRGVKQLKIGGGWQTARFELEPGIRAVRTHVFVSPKWQMTFALRPGSGTTAVPALGRFQVYFEPKWAQVFLDGKPQARGKKVRCALAFMEVPVGEHLVEVRWPDGRRASERFGLEAGGNVNMFLSAGNRVLSRQVLAPPGSHTFLYRDAGDKLWLLWDQAVDAHWSMNPSQESDIFCATSTDGVTWSAPRCLPVSSSSLDMRPILQQDRYGTYWLVWTSSRDPEDPKWLWIASSEDGSKWSFPRKVVVPIADEDDVARWRETHVPCFAFTIDIRNTFWLVWQGHLFRAESGRGWKEVEVLKTKNRGKSDNTWPSICYFLSGDKRNCLLLLSDRFVRVGTRGEKQIGLWQRNGDGTWLDRGVLTEAHTLSAAISVENQGRTIAAFARSDGIFLRTCDGRHKWSDEVMIESGLKKPFDPSVACLPNGRCVVAYSSQDGVVTVLVDLSSIQQDG